jgi:hypothetical protein
MAEQGWTWRVPRGDSRTRQFTFTAGGVPQDLAGYTVLLTVATAPDATPTFTEAGSASGTVASVTLDPTKTAAAPAGRYHACLRVSKGGSPGPWTSVGYLELQPHA